jgi:hypothetical protein
VDKLIESMVLFREKEIYIGQQITNAVAIASTKQMIIGSCTLCHKGELKIIKSHTTMKRFVGCSNYSSDGCKTTAPLPQKGSIKITDKRCSICRWPIISVIFAHQSKYTWKICINMQCPSKNRTEEISTN